MLNFKVAAFAFFGALALQADSIPWQWVDDSSQNDWTTVASSNFGAINTSYSRTFQVFSPTLLTVSANVDAITSGFYCSFGSCVTTFGSDFTESGFWFPFTTGSWTSPPGPGSGIISGTYSGSGFYTQLFEPGVYAILEGIRGGTHAPSASSSTLKLTTTVKVTDPPWNPVSETPEPRWLAVFLLLILLYVARRQNRTVRV